MTIFGGGGMGWFPRDHLPERRLCRRQIIRKAIFLGGNFQGGFSGGKYLWGNCPGAIIQGAVIREAIFLVINYPLVQLSRWQLYGGQFFLLFVIIHSVKNVKPSSINGVITGVNFLSKRYIYNEICIQFIVLLLTVCE